MATLRPQNGNEEGVKDNDVYDSNEKVRGDVEGGRAEPRNSVGSKGKEDPFGDEENSEVKYRTMAWW